MTDILTLGNLLRLARDTVSNPREGAATVLSFAPARQALWLMFALVDRPVAPAARDRGVYFRRFARRGADHGSDAGLALILGLVMAGFLYLTIHAVHRIGGFSAARAVSRRRRCWSSGCSSS
jgi:hypothetical protein